LAWPPTESLPVFAPLPGEEVSHDGDEVLERLIAHFVMQKVAGAGKGDLLARVPGRRDLFDNLRRDRPASCGIAGQQQEWTGNASDRRAPGRGKRDRREQVQQREVELRLRL
jgi:hypothetical protein